MSKSIGKLLGAGSCPININEQVIQNYLAKFNQPTANNLSTPIANNNQPPQPLAYNQMLANGMRAQNASAFVQYDLDKQIAQLHQSLPNNPTLQQQYTQMLANLLSQQIHHPAAPVTPSPQPTPSLNQPVQYAQNNLPSTANDANQLNKTYRLGTLSGLYESVNNPAAIGVDNAGGPSYGAYQIATTPGTMNNYINFLQQSPQYQSFADILNKAGGNVAATTKSPTFVNAWQQLSRNKDFNDSQYNFIISTHLNPLINAIQDKDILNLENRHPVVKDALYSMSVQHRAAPQIVNNTLRELKQNYGSNPSDIDDAMILRSLYKNRTDYVKTLPESQYAGDKKITRQEKMNIINKRYPKELQDALNFLLR